MSVQHNLARIMEMADRMARECIFGAHEIYVLARDAADMATDKEQLPPGTILYKGLKISRVALDFLRDGQMINAIKDTRTFNKANDGGSLGLKEAKDLIEDYMAEVMSIPKPTLWKPVTPPTGPAHNDDNWDARSHTA